VKTGRTAPISATGWPSTNYADPKDRVGATDIRYLCLAFRFYSASLVSKAAAVLGREKEAEEYAGLALDLREKIRREYFAPDGSFALETQTACVVALFLGLPPEPEKTARKLMGLLKDNGMRLTTGFIGTPWLCRALSRYGYSREAWTLLLNEDCPSWLYEVKMGATTIWERWNSYCPTDIFPITGMNSIEPLRLWFDCRVAVQEHVRINPVEDTPASKRSVRRSRTLGSKGRVRIGLGLRQVCLRLEACGG
jgi:alpha-L-rhamnosidase